MLNTYNFKINEKMTNATDHIWLDTEDGITFDWQMYFRDLTEELNEAWKGYGREFVFTGITMDEETDRAYGLYACNYKGSWVPMTVEVYASGYFSVEDMYDSKVA